MRILFFSLVTQFLFIFIIKCYIVHIKKIISGLSALVLGTYENQFGKEETLIGSDR